MVPGPCEPKRAQKSPAFFGQGWGPGVLVDLLGLGEGHAWTDVPGTSRFRSILTILIKCLVSACYMHL
jgi:hypothetical protein